MVVHRGPAADFSNDVLELLEAHWDPERGYCVPNPRTYPHLWLWDSCFHAVVWAHLGDTRAVQELAAVLEGQLPGGLVPHMRYADAGARHVRSDRLRPRRRSPSRRCSVT